MTLLSWMSMGEKYLTHASSPLLWILYSSFLTMKCNLFINPKLCVLWPVSNDRIYSIIIRNTLFVQFGIMLISVLAHALIIVRVITVLCHLRKNDLMYIISCLTRVWSFGHYFMLYLSNFIKNAYWPYFV